MRGEVGGRRAGAEIEQADTPRAHRGAFALADPYGAIDALVDQVRAALAAAELELNVWIACKKARQRRHDDQSCDQCGYFDTQESLRTCMPLPERLFRLAHQSQDGKAARVVGSPIGRHTDFTSGPVEQLHAEARFQLLDQ